MSLDQRITVTCDHQGCKALRETRAEDADPAVHRIEGIAAGWAYDGRDYCSKHRNEATR